MPAAVFACRSESSLEINARLWGPQTLHYNNRVQKQQHSCLRDWRLSASGGPIEDPPETLRTSKHYNNRVSDSIAFWEIGVSRHQGPNCPRTSARQKRTTITHHRLLYWLWIIDSYTCWSVMIQWIEDNAFPFLSMVFCCDVRGVSGGPQLGPPDTERRQSLGQLKVCL